MPEETTPSPAREPREGTTGPGAHVDTQAVENSSQDNGGDVLRTEAGLDSAAPTAAQPNPLIPPATTAPAAVAPDTSEPPAPAGESMATLLQTTDAAKPPTEVKVGDRIRGRIVSIGPEQTFVDYGGRAEASIATAELRGRNGEVLLRQGDALTASVASADDVVTLTLGKRRGVVQAARLRLAFETGLPVLGTVRAANKGGFDVNVGGVRAFCPLSQIDVHFVDDASVHVGKRYTFKVLRWEKNGRNIVVSRRSILKQESAEKARETRKQLAVDAVFDGIVTRVQPFGAFVDIGGIEGLLHVSRMAHGHVDDPGTIAKPGGALRVRVVGIENPGTRKERIALALAELGPDPWVNALAELHEGDVVRGTVARVTPFGAFVNLAVGIDGLVHISELAPRKVNDPREVVNPGDAVEVRVLRIEPDKRRVSLSLRLAAEATPPPTSRREPRRPRPARQPRPAPSPASAAGPLTHTMAEQLGALRNKLRKQP